MWGETEYYDYLPSPQVLARRIGTVHVTATGSPLTARTTLTDTPVFWPSLAWNGSAYAHLLWPSTRKIVVRTLDRTGNPTGAVREVAFDSYTVPMGLTFAGDDLVVAYQTEDQSAARNFVARLNPDGLVRRFSFGGVVPRYGVSWADVAANGAGELVAVVNEIRPDHLGALSFVVVGYNIFDFTPLRPARLRAVRR